MRSDILKFDKTYFTLAVFSFGIEVFIALYIHDNFVRPYFGDVLVVILIYCFIKSFLKSDVFAVALFTLHFAFTIEFLQYLNIVEMLDLQNSKTARIVIGTSFSWSDILSYIVGILIVISVEYFHLKKSSNRLVR